MDDSSIAMVLSFVATLSKPQCARPFARQSFRQGFRQRKTILNLICYSIKNYDVDEAEEKLKAGGLKDIRKTSGRIYFSDPDKLTVQLAAEVHTPN